MKNQQIARIFNEIAELLELKGENVFRIRAYRRAAQNIDGLSKDVAALSHEDLEAIPGIGKDLANKVQEYLETGKIAKHEELKKEIPEGVLQLLQVPQGRVQFAHEGALFGPDAPLQAWSSAVAHSP